MDSNVVMAGFGLAWDEVRRLVEVNAKHRKGFRLGEVPVWFVLDQSQEELTELDGAVDRWQHENEPQAEVCIELGDLLGVLFHLAHKMGFTPEQLTRSMLDKFKQRFTE